MFDAFTDRARRVVVLAQEEARMLNHNYIGTEHFLLGLIHEGEGVAHVALESLGVSMEDARRRIEELVPPGDTPPTGHIPFTPRAKKVLELARREGLQLGHHYIGTEHLLLGLIREGEGVAAQVLTALGVELDAARQAVIRAVGGHSGPRGVEMGPIEPNIVRRASGWAAIATYDPTKGPLCSMCKAPLAENAKHQVIDVPAHVGAGVVQILVVYCTNCGDTVKVEILPEET